MGRKQEKLQKKMARHQAYVRSLPRLEKWWPLVRKGTIWTEAGLPSIFCTLVAVAVYIYHIHRAHINIDVLGHTVTILPVSLLLVFRTNISYARYWEGRGYIGALVHHCRDLIRKGRAYFPEQSYEFGKYVRYFALSARWDLHSRIAAPDIEEDAPELTVQQRDHLESVGKGHPMVLLRWLGDFLFLLNASRQVSPMVQMELHSHLDGLQAAWEGMAKIQGTPLPFPYEHLAKFLIYVWCLTLPFGIVSKMTYFTPATTLFMSLALFGLNQAGIEIENPFGVDLNVRLSILCRIFYCPISRP
eukprot:TRINITY_DN3694_c0_g1_i1.p1 TRINITY_DN3694_c0_g1~~TRINITY_DN3694_c0_g1_i1.p1  ORF type:complete len:302 (-),score=17.24 TRINITY_DN3694_c0_g1_i1:640-1545(-)